MRGFAVALALAWCSAAIAQDDENPRPEVIELEVDAVAVGSEPLRWALLPPAHETRPGNAANAYDQAFASLHLLGSTYSQVWVNRLSGLDGDAYVAALRDAGGPESVFPPHMRPLALRNHAGLHALHQAARMDPPRYEVDFAGDWLSEVLATLPDFRMSVRLLCLRAEFALVAGDFDAAAHDLRCAYAMARHLDRAQPAILMNDLVAIAMHALIDGAVQERWITSPAAPNLYLALAEFPSPPVSFHESLRFERTMLVRSIPEFAEPRAVRTDPEWLDVMQRLADHALTHDIALDLGMIREGWPQALTMSAWAIRTAPQARRRLVERRGVAPTEAEALSPMAASMSFLVGQYHGGWAALHAAMMLPPAEALPWIDEHRDAVEADWAGQGGLLAACAGEEAPMFGSMIHLFEAMKAGEARVARTHARLRLIEALRHHAATHGGWPETLDQLELPAPQDPATGRPFLYRVQDAAALIEAQPVAGLTQDRDRAVYRITLREPAPAVGQ